MESENFKERLIEFARKQYDMGQTNFEAFTGIAPGSINKIRSGISTSSLANIAERCSELSLRWPLLEPGDMLPHGWAQRHRGRRAGLPGHVGERVADADYNAARNIATWGYVSTHERWDMLSCSLHDDLSTSKANAL